MIVIDVNVILVPDNFSWRAMHHGYTLGLLLLCLQDAVNVKGSGKLPARDRVQEFLSLNYQGILNNELANGLNLIINAGLYLTLKKVLFICLPLNEDSKTRVACRINRLNLKQRILRAVGFQQDIRVNLPNRTIKHYTCGASWDLSESLCKPPEVNKFVIFAQLSRYDINQIFFVDKAPALERYNVDLIDSTRHALRLVNHIFNFSHFSLNNLALSLAYNICLSVQQVIFELFMQLVMSGHIRWQIWEEISQLF